MYNYPISEQLNTFWIEEGNIPLLDVMVAIYPPKHIVY